ncbi:MAG: ribosomal protein S18-alanine N-acetyltransferase [Erysipelotrichaceae bacterium]|nr:ribosomal protein S18-alanine N-acetyltransferase [Erysipelotrichaceae bacterium]
MMRRMRVSDLDEVLAIEEKCFPIGTWNRSQYLYELNENPYSRLWVLEQQGKIVGYYDLWTIFERAEIATIAVAPEHQKRHYGGQLMRHLIAQAREQHCENISLEVRVSNQAAISMYEHFDFIIINTRPGYYRTADGYEDAYLMMRGI